MTLPNAINLFATVGVDAPALTLSGPLNAKGGSSEFDPDANTRLTLTGSLSGNLNVGGSGTVVLNGALDGSVATVADSAQLQFGSAISGSGGVTLAGGLLASASQDNKFAGLVVLQNGTIRASADNALGSATLQVTPATETAWLQASEFSLNNPVTLNGGTLNVSGNLTLAGTITIAAETTILPAFTATTVALRGAIGDASAGILDVQGPGSVTLNGTLGAGTVVNAGVGDASGTVLFGPQLDGTGTVNVNAGTLRSSAANAFAGTVNVNAGTLRLGGDGVLGTAVLNLGSAGGTSTATLDPITPTTLGNTVHFYALTLTVEPGNLHFTGSVLEDAAGAIDPDEGAFVTLGGSLALDSGAAAGATLTLGGTGLVTLTHTFSGNGGITVGKGGELSSSGVGGYTGAITLNGGTADALENDAFGAAGAGRWKWRRAGASSIRPTPAVRRP